MCYGCILIKGPRCLYFMLFKSYKSYPKSNSHSGKASNLNVPSPPPPTNAPLYKQSPPLIIYLKECCIIKCNTFKYYNRINIKQNNLYTYRKVRTYFKFSQRKSDRWYIQTQWWERREDYCICYCVFFGCGGDQVTWVRPNFRCLAAMSKYLLVSWGFF